MQQRRTMMWSCRTLAPEVHLEAVARALSPRKMMVTTGGRVFLWFASRNLSTWLRHQIQPWNPWTRIPFSTATWIMSEPGRVVRLLRHLHLQQTAPRLLYWRLSVHLPLQTPHGFRLRHHYDPKAADPTIPRHHLTDYRLQQLVDRAWFE